MKNSVYITWAKNQAGARYNLANSGILGCDLNDLPVTMEDVALNGPNGEGYAPLKEAIAAKYGVSADQVVTAQGGTSMVNFLAMATVIERGDEALVEQSTYEPLLGALEFLGAEVKRFAAGKRTAVEIVQANGPAFDTWGTGAANISPRMFSKVPVGAVNEMVMSPVLSSVLIPLMFCALPSAYSFAPTITS